mgnify:FL=1
MKKIIQILIFIPLFANGQDTLTLYNALSIGLQENFNIQISKKNQAISNINNNWANAGALPKLDISASMEEALSDQSNNPASFIQEKLKSSSISASTYLNWTLFNGFAIRANKERLENLEKISNNSASLSIENTIQGIILQYNNCILQKQKLNVLQKVVAQNKKRLIYQNKKYELGVITKIELLQTESSLLSDSINIILQHQNYINSLKNLNLLLGVESEKEWTLSKEINVKIQIYSYEDLKESTLNNNTNILNQYYNIQLSKQNMKLEISSFYPIISINSGATYNESTYDIGNLSNTMNNTGESINYFANFAINFRIFDGGKLYKSLKGLKIKKEIDELKFSQKKQEVLHQLSIAYDAYNTSITALKLSEKASEIAHTNYNLAVKRHEQGIINSFTLRDIEIAYINSAIVAEQAIYNLMEHKVSLLKITGNIIQDFSN